MSRKSKAPRTPVLGIGLVAGRRSRRISCSCGTAEVEMPVVGGLDILRAIRYNRPDTLVFLVGADHGGPSEASESAALQARNLGAKGYFRKPLNEHTLALEVKAAHEEKVNRRVLRSIGIRGGKLRMVG